MAYRRRDSSAALSFGDHSTTGAPSTIVIVAVNTEFVPNHSLPIPASVADTLPLKTPKSLIIVHNCTSQDFYGKLLCVTFTINTTLQLIIF